MRPELYSSVIMFVFSALPARALHATSRGFDMIDDCATCGERRRISIVVGGNLLEQQCDRKRVEGEEEEKCESTVQVS